MLAASPTAMAAENAETTIPRFELFTGGEVNESSRGCHWHSWSADFQNGRSQFKRALNHKGDLPRRLSELNPEMNWLQRQDSNLQPHG
jgi:hypothetical protein